MKYYSEKLKKMFETEEALVKEEKELEAKKAEEVKKSEEKRKRAEEVEDAYRNYQTVKHEAFNSIKEAENKFLELKEKFIEDYHSFHMSYYKDGDTEQVSVGEILDSVLKNLFE